MQIFQKSDTLIDTDVCTLCQVCMGFMAVEKYQTDSPSLQILLQYRTYFLPNKYMFEKNLKTKNKKDMLM